MKGFVTVVERQLDDLLPNGTYGQESSSELTSLAHCKVTNLLSEYEFGDLGPFTVRKKAFSFWHTDV